MLERWLPNRRVGKKKPGDDVVPDFEIVLWGYDPGQVDRCLREMSVRLDEALSRLESVNLLHEQLTRARLELDQLRVAAARRPSFTNRLAAVMEHAERLRSQAERAAQGAGSGHARR